VSDRFFMMIFTNDITPDSIEVPTGVRVITDQTSGPVLVS